MAGVVPQLTSRIVLATVIAMDGTKKHLRKANSNSILLTVFIVFQYLFRFACFFFVVSSIIVLDWFYRWFSIYSIQMIDLILSSSAFFSSGKLEDHTPKPSHIRVVFEHPLGSVAVMHIEVNDKNFGCEACTKGFGFFGDESVELFRCCFVCCVVFCCLFS